MKVRFIVAVVLIVWLLPWCVPVVEAQVQGALLSHSFGWLNPGNAVGMLLGGSAGGAVVSLIAAAARRVKRGTVREVLWWLFAVTAIATLYLGVKEALVLLVGPKPGFLTAVTVAGLGIVQVTRKRFPEYQFDPHVRGPRLVSSKDIRRSRGELPPGLVPWGADYIDFKDENEHFMLLGNIGGGKTTYLKVIMSWLGWREGELWIVFDPKIELVPFLKALGKRVLIFNPLDRRRVAWNICADIVNEPQVLTLVKVLIPDAEGQENYWSQSAQNLLTSVIGFFIRSGKWWDLRDVLLACSSEQFLKRIVGDDAFDTIIADGLKGKNEHSGTNDYMLTLNNRLRPLRVMAALWHSADEKVSLRKLIESGDFEDTVIVLGNDNTSGATIQQLNSILFERLVNLILDLPDSDLRRIWLFIDEVSEASRFVGNNLVRFMTMARSRGGCAVLSAQNTAGIEAQFREKAARQILELSQRLAVLGGVDGETARVVSETYIGEVEVIESQVGYSEGFDGTEREVSDVFKKRGEREVSPTLRRVKRHLVPKEALFSSSIPKTGKENGLTGLFVGGIGGHHWHNFSWKEVQDMQIKPDEKTKAYDRVGQKEPGLQLAPWSNKELQKWGFLEVTERKEEKNLFDEFGGSNEQLTRESVLRMLPLEDSELDEIAAECGIEAGLKAFTRQQLTKIGACIGFELLGVSIEWEQ
ncbi:conjugal transfer protein [Leptolyngbya sp. Heron Island J]|uniref:type IV secretory system conjugative DNA transfer family protein n=1 Tax=Leptolyngbya sp. Heron Island J TaxID=1385935 RepID=UPI0003B9B256|nr:type IV secretion system DNA-binding domain-containing protein [Leptolyngbya sp. Heron Island J]ESA36560.1 conjugal transfer protein [Leptolyngbya sp. Heron Island J]